MTSGDFALGYMVDALHFIEIDMIDALHFIEIEN